MGTPAKQNIRRQVDHSSYFSTPFGVGFDYILSIIKTNNTNHRLVDELHTNYFILGTWLRIAH
jgi:hypothetical protein